MVFACAHCLAIERAAMPIITQFSPGPYHSIPSLSIEKKKILSLFYNHTRDLLGVALVITFSQHISQFTKNWSCRFMNFDVSFEEHH